MRCIPHLQSYSCKCRALDGQIVADAYPRWDDITVTMPLELLVFFAATHSGTNAEFINEVNT